MAVTGNEQPGACFGRGKWLVTRCDASDRSDASNIQRPYTGLLRCTAMAGLHS